VDDKIIYTPDQLNTLFETPQTVRPSNIDFDSAYDSPTEEFAFIKTFELEVYNAIHQIRSNAIGADGVPIKFPKIILPQILPYPSVVEIIKNHGPTIQEVSQTIGILASC
jgi:hypothetical protein